MTENNSSNKERFQKAYAELRRDKENHRIEYLLKKKCKCEDVNDCVGYKRERNKLFDKRSDMVFAMGVMRNE